MVIGFEESRGVVLSESAASYLSLCALAASLLAGCALTPDAGRPGLVTEIEGLDQYTSEGFKTSPIAPENWWYRLGDQELTSLVDELRLQSLSLNERRLQVDQAQELAVQARSGRLPSITGSSDVSSTGSEGLDGSFEFSELYSVGITADLNTDIFGGLRSADRSAILVADAAELSFRSFEQLEVSSLVRNWVAASTLKRQLALAVETAESFRNTFDLTDARYRAGSSTVSAGDVQIARQNYDSALTDIPDLRTQLAVQLFEIDQQLARLPGETANSFQGNARFKQDLNVPIGTPVDLLSNRPDVAAAELSYRAALEDVGSARADLYPALTLSTSFSFQDDTAADLFRADAFITSLVASITQPIFNGGRLRSDVRLQVAEAEELATAFARTTLEALIEVEQAAAQLVGINEQLQRLEDNLASAQLSDQITQNRYRRGLETLLSVLESQRTLNTAQQSLISAEQAYLNAYVDLFLSLGGAWFERPTDTTNTPSSEGEEEHELAKR